VEELEPNCLTNADRDYGLVCKDDTCSACTADPDCDDGKSCADGTCVNPPTVPRERCVSSTSLLYRLPTRRASLAVFLCTLPLIRRGGRLPMLTCR
jgi:hypothetical protein